MFNFSIIYLILGVKEDEEFKKEMKVLILIRAGVE